MSTIEISPLPKDATFTINGNTIAIRAGLDEEQGARHEYVFSDNVARTVHRYVFYCNSVAKTDANYKILDVSGDGTKDNPWTDLNNALDVICCMADGFCPYSVALVIKVTGTVNYAIQKYTYDNYRRNPFPGNNVVFIDATDAVIDVVYPNQRTPYFSYNVAFYCPGTVFEASDITVHRSAISDWGMGSLSALNLNRNRFVFKTLTLRGLHIANDLYVSTFIGERIELKNAEKDTGGNPGHYVDSYFAVDNIHVDLSDASDYFGSYYLFYGCLRCVFSDCTCTVSLSDYALQHNGGAAWHEDEETTWLGTNTGFWFNRGERRTMINGNFV